MPMPEHEGRYRAEVLSAGVGETKSGLMQVVIRFALTEELNEGQWVDVRPYDWQITAYECLENKDGALNEFKIQRLRDAFSWQTDDPFWLEDNDLPPCQVALRWESYQGKDSLRVGFIDAYDYSGNGAGEVPHSDDDMRRRIRARLGSKFRATAPAPPRPTDPRPAAPPPRAAAPPVPDDDEATVWAEFSKECSERGVPEDVVRTLWNDALTAVAGEALDALDGAQCQDLRIALGEALSKL